MDTANKIAMPYASALNAMTKCMVEKGTIFIAGNGGSASDAQHIAGELVGRLRKTRKAISAIALTTDTSVLTSIANDMSYEEVFSRQIEAHGKKGDVFLAITTSGRSNNIHRALGEANKCGLTTILLSGRTGGKCTRIAQISILVPSEDTCRIQELHKVIYHSLCEDIENSIA
jgi:D-sedoheptulose 7-phosphate isomerase